MDNKVLIALLSALTIVSLTSQLTQNSQVTTIGSTWQEWKDQQGKTYTTEEEPYRLAQFMNKQKIIQEHNAKDSKYKLTINKFADLSREELKTKNNGYKSIYEGADFPLYEAKSTDVANTKDWRDLNAVTPVKDQGQCGSCWAFGTVGGIEGSYAIFNDNLVSFSEQQINSCDHSDAGCNGGDLPTAYSYVNGAGLETEEDYPYTSGTGKTGRCSVDSSKLTIGVGEISGYAVQTNSKADFLAALNDQPLSICVEADSDAFYYYESGIVDASSGCGTSLDHCVTAVGYDTTASEPYVIVKNSWNTDWGDEGYILISLDDSNSAGVCGIYEEPYIAQINA